MGVIRKTSSHATASVPCPQRRADGKVQAGREADGRTDRLGLRGQLAVRPGLPLVGRAARAATAVGHAAHHGTGRPPPRYGSSVLVMVVMLV